MYFAELDDNKIVKQVIVADSKEWCEQYLDGIWVKAHDPLDAAIGYTYDEIRNAFISQKPYESWILDEETCNWNAPVPMPNDGGMYEWNEEVGDWVAIDEEV